MQDKQIKKYKIGEVSRITGISTSRLRYYDKIGIFSPAGRDDASDYRYYTSYQLERVFLIAQFQYFGFTLDQIQSLMDGTNPYFETEHKITQERLSELDTQIAKLEKLRTKLREMDEYTCAQINEYNDSGYIIERMTPCTYIISDEVMDLSYSYHFEKAIHLFEKYHEIDSKLPWYVSNEFYQISLSSLEYGVRGKYCIRFLTRKELTSEIPLVRENQSYCIKYTDYIPADAITGHVEKMLHIASLANYVPAIGHYYVGELSVEADPNDPVKDRVLRQIIIPLEKNRRPDINF